MPFDVRGCRGDPPRQPGGAGVKPNLIIGLGNPLMGDEGVGWHVVQLLACDPRLPHDTDVLPGGTDLLRWAGEIGGRRRVILVDALLDPAEAGAVTVFRNGFDELDGAWRHVHHVSLAQAVGLLRLAWPSLASTRFTLVAVSINSAEFGGQLSPALAAALPGIADGVLRELTCS